MVSKRICEDWAILCNPDVLIFHEPWRRRFYYATILRSTFLRQDFNGTNSYAVLASPRHSGTEAMIISASWISRSGEENGSLNLRGVATVLGLAGFLKRKWRLRYSPISHGHGFADYSYWSKDIIFVISDGYLEGMQAWLSSYHGSTQIGVSKGAP